MSQYKLATYQSAQGPRAGLVVDEMIFDIAAATGRAAYVTMLDVLRDWDAARGPRDAATAARKTRRPGCAARHRAAAAGADAGGNFLRRAPISPTT